MTDNLKTRLLACPCCGAADIRSEVYERDGVKSGWLVECNPAFGCGLSIWRMLERTAIAAWNTRQAPAVPDDIAWLVEQLQGQSPIFNPHSHLAAQALIALQARNSALVEALEKAGEAMFNAFEGSTPSNPLRKAKADLIAALTKDTPDAC